MLQYLNPAGMDEGILMYRCRYTSVPLAVGPEKQTHMQSMACVPPLRSSKNVSWDYPVYGAATMTMADATASGEVYR